MIECFEVWRKVPCMNEIQLEDVAVKKICKLLRWKVKERMWNHHPGLLFSLLSMERGRGGEKAMLNLGGSKGRGKDPGPTSCFL